MKKMFIYKKTGKILKDGTDEIALLRMLTTHPTFVGISNNRDGINVVEFRKLAIDLEPSHTFFNVVDA